jgi:hypothetical protein
MGKTFTPILCILFFGTPCWLKILHIFHYQSFITVLPLAIMDLSGIIIAEKTFMTQILMDCRPSLRWLRNSIGRYENRIMSLLFVHSNLDTDMAETMKGRELEKEHL